ncbi:hypothetical protein NE237_001642 [Protea cynaroides]|uniref:Uncharacterized protein n=1 Tax=Protea cynaroides TaxID=273540 RepID=A0A9Q0KUI8_9MAGN|nr:hypothetical protein NE237_001642 [Protea cynaroides]
MTNSTEPSSFLSFASSSHISNDSSSFNMSVSSGPESVASLEVFRLSWLGCNLEQLLDDPTFDYSDAEVVVEDISVGVHRCILAARSRFFHDLFLQKNTSSQKEGKPRYRMTDLVPYYKVGYEAFMIFLSYLYTGKLKSSPLEVSTCVDAVCAHDACRPAINFVVELTYASAIFKITELVSLFQRHLLNFVEKAFVEDVIPILLVSFHCQLDQLLTHCINRVAQSDLDSISIEKDLPFAITETINSLRFKSQPEKTNGMVTDLLFEKRIKRIHKALDSDDVELVKLLLSESGATLDDANALHYAAAYCEPKVLSEVLDLGLTDINLRNSRGYTVLHVAAMRKEPSVIVSLLTKGASALETTSNGQSAVTICRRLTRPKDYDAKAKHGQETKKDRLCIDILEREMRRIPLAGDLSISSPVMADDLPARLLYLENRVAFARLLFPSEAKLAMDIAQTDTTFEFIGLSASKSCGNIREVDLNETPTMRQKRLCLRLEALCKTVEMGRHYFPHCSQVLDKFLEEDLPGLFYLEEGDLEEGGDQRSKRALFTELKEDVQKAFNKDKAEISRSGLSSSSSSSLKGYVNYKVSF